MPPVSGERQRAEEFARLLDALDADLRHGGDGPAGTAGLEGYPRPEDAPVSDTPAHGAGHSFGLPSSDTPSPDAVPRVPRQGVDPELARMLAAVERLIAEARACPVELSAERKAQDVAMLHRLAVEDPAPPSGRHRGGGTPWRRRLIGGGVAVGVLSGGLGGVAWAASKALPGDPLYGVKRGLENMRVSVSGSDQARGEQYLGQARTRLGEIHSLLGRHDANVDGSETAGLVSGAVDNLYRDVDNASSLLVPLAEQGNAQAYMDLTHFLAVYEPQVRDLQTLLAPESQDQAARLLSLMQSLDTKMAEAKTVIDKARNPHGIPGITVTTAAPDAAPSAAPSGAASSAGQAASGGQEPGPGGAQAPAPSPDGGLQLQLPLGPSATVEVPPLLSGLPPIGITLGGGGATGPTTGGVPPTDPNPN